MPRRRNKQRKANSRFVPRSIQDVLGPVNPVISINNFRLRFQATAPAAGTCNIKASDLTNLIVVPTVASTTIATAAFLKCISSIKLKKVQAVMPGVDGAMHTLSIKTIGSGTAPGGSATGWHSASVLSSSDFAIVTWVPEKDTAASYWLDALSDTDTLFSIVESGAIPVFVDIWVDLRLMLGYGTSAMDAFGSLTTLGATPTAGQMMYRPLNASGSGVASTTLLLFIGFGDDNSGAFSLYP